MDSEADDMTDKSKTCPNSRDPWIYINRGLRFVVPILVTAVLLWWAYGKLAPILSAPFLWLYAKCGISIPKAGSIGYELLCVVQTIGALGLLLLFIGYSFGESLKRGMQRILERMPIVGVVFKPVNQAVESLLGVGMAGKPVVRFPFPAAPCTAIGIVMDQEKVNGVDCCVVMMPLTMSAGTGVLITVPADQIQILEGVEASQALAYAISCAMTKLK